jgi:hypothetical protein
MHKKSHTDEKMHPMLHGQHEKSSKKWISGAIKKPGALRKSLNVKPGENIPESKLKKAEHSNSPKTRKRAYLAETLKKLRK